MLSKWMERAVRFWLTVRVKNENRLLEMVTGGVYSCVRMGE